MAFSNYLRGSYVCHAGEFNLLHHFIDIKSLKCTIYHELTKMNMTPIKLYIYF